MVDNGASVNLIKIGALDWDLMIKKEGFAKIGGITPDTRSTLGTVELTIKGTPYEFYVVYNEFPIMDNGILGRNSMKREEAVISYYTNCLMIAGDVMNPILFLTPEERHFHIQRRPELNEREREN